MKRIFLLGGLLAVGYFAFGKKNQQNPSNGSALNPNSSITVDTIIEQNKGKIVANVSTDPNYPGTFYTLVLPNGSVRPPQSSDYSTYETVQVDFPFWETIASTRSELIVK